MVSALLLQLAYTFTPLFSQPLLPIAVSNSRRIHLPEASLPPPLPSSNIQATRRYTATFSPLALLRLSLVTLAGSRLTSSYESSSHRNLSITVISPWLSTSSLSSCF